MAYFISSCSGTGENLTWELNCDTVDPETSLFPLICLPIPFQLLSNHPASLSPRPPLPHLNPSVILTSPFAPASILRPLPPLGPSRCSPNNGRLLSPKIIPSCCASSHKPASSHDNWLIRCHHGKWKVKGQQIRQSHKAVNPPSLLVREEEDWKRVRWGRLYFIEVSKRVKSVGRTVNGWRDWEELGGGGIESWINASEKEKMREE